MRVQFVSSYSPARATGGALRSAGFARALEKSGVEVDVTRPDLKGPPRAWSYFINRQWDARDGEYDVVHFDSLYLAPLCSQIKKSTVFIDIVDSPIQVRRSYMSTSPTKHVKGLPGLIITRSLLAIALRFASGVSYISDEDRLADARLWSGSRAQTFTIPSGISAELLAAQFDPPPYTNQTLVMPGDWTYPPNADGLAWFCRLVWPLVKASLPQVCLHLYGPSSPRGSLPDGVRYVGFTQNISDVYRDAAVVIGPLLSGGGVKTKLVEAAAACRPIVCTSAAAWGLPESIIANAHVADTPEKFAAEICRALDGDDESRLRHTQAAVRSGFSWDRAAAILLDAYQQIADRKR